MNSRSTEGPGRPPVKHRDTSLHDPTSQGMRASWGILGPHSPRRVQTDTILGPFLDVLSFRPTNQGPPRHPPPRHTAQHHTL